MKHFGESDPLCPVQPMVSTERPQQIQQLNGRISKLRGILSLHHPKKEKLLSFPFY